ncbi:MAG: transposase [Opitutae bacterium]|nr:transposase [Opitutae bacterium]
MPSPPNESGYAALRRFRYSAPGAEYFLTTNLESRGSGLEGSATAAAVRGQWTKLEQDGLWRVRTAVVMPDHIHLLVNPGEKVALSECVRAFKGRLSPVLRGNGLRWQEGYYDHRMRETEDRLPVFLYIFLNPYRANLAPGAETWPGYYCEPADWAWFGGLTNEESPWPEWLNEVGA